MTKASWIFLPAMALGCASLAWSQAALDVNIGFGTAHDTTSGGGIDGPASLNAFGPCTPGSSDGLCQATPALNGFFLGLGADIMLYKRFGVGAQFNFQPTQKNYGPLQARQSFIDFDGIYAPISNKRMELRLLGGVGIARTGFGINQGGCIGTVVCNNSTQPIGAANHFDLNVGAGVQIYLTDHIFLRPQFDFHYVPNLTQQFGHDYVPEATIWLGYNFGER